MICQFSRFHYFSFQVAVWWLHYVAWSVHATRTSVAIESKSDSSYLGSYWIKIR